MRVRLASALALLALSSAPAAARSVAGLEESVVRIVNYSQRSDWASPWSSSSVIEVSGSGFVIEGGVVMTNAHVVSDARLLVIVVNNDPNPHEAEVVFIGHDCDLALIRPKEGKALAGITPLAFGSVPKLGTPVETLGYPSGGVRVSSTRGVVSRIEEQGYLHSGVDAHLAVQTDAAINPGSSGGPVIQNGRVVGVAFQTNVGLQGTGYFIPTEVISHFLHDIADGRYDGYPDLGVEWANMENPAARARAGMADGETGVRVTRTMLGSSAEGKIRPGDVMLAIGGRPLANDGSVADGGDRIPHGLLIDRMYMGDSVTVRLLRDGKRFDVAVPLSRAPLYDTRRNEYDEKPRYFVYGGLVFVPLNLETMKTFGEDWPHKAPAELLDEYFHRILMSPDLQRVERVVLLRRLDDPVNTEMAWFQDQIVERVNGREITGLSSLIEAFEQSHGDFDVIEFAHARRFGVLDRKKAEEASARLLAAYGIAKDRQP
jgi:S1-C subfamily serine protease